MAWLSIKKIQRMGFASVGEDVLLSEKASFYNCSKISLGNHLRIDDFCVLSAGQGGIFIGNHVHISVYTALIGAGKITVSDFCGIASRAVIYSSNDDYSGAAMSGPTLPAEYTSMHHSDVFLDKHVMIGSGCVVLPGVRFELGACVGALSLVRESCMAFHIYAGVPAKPIKERKRDFLKMEQTLLEKRQGIIKYAEPL